MVDVQESVTYLTEDDDWLKTVAIGGVLSILSFLLIPTFIVFGYVLEVIRYGLDDRAEPPVFEDWGALLVDGFKAWLVSIVYMLVPLAVAAITVGGTVLSVLTGSETLAAVGLAGLFGGLALSGILSIVFGYFAVVGIVNFANEGRLGAAFDLGRIFSIGTNSGYAIAFGFSLLVFFAVGIVGGAIAAIPVVGWIASAFLFFYAYVVAGHLWGRGFAEATDREPGATMEESGDMAV